MAVLTVLTCLTSENNRPTMCWRVTDCGCGCFHVDADMSMVYADFEPLSLEVMTGVEGQD